MDYTILGRTGMGTSVIGVGTGGPSGIGTRTGRSEGESARIIRSAIDGGVNFIDTAEAYRTEHIVALAIKDVPRETIYISTKVSSWEEFDPVAIERNVEDRLRTLGTDYLDICHFHAVTIDEYDRVVDELYPVLDRLREAGKIRFTGITERFNADPEHRMLSRAVQDDLWDVMMVGFNLLNQSARERVLSATRSKGIGVLAMFAVRLALSRTDRLREVIAGLIDSGQLREPELLECGGNREDPLGFVTKESDAETLVEAAYRFVRHEDGIDVTLSGSGSESHMRENIASCQRPPLPPELVAKLVSLFANVDSVTAQ